MRLLRFTIPFAYLFISAASASAQPVANRVVIKDSDVYVIYADGRSQNRLTSDGTPKDSASLSPDGKRVAFLGDADDHSLGHIVTILSDGTGRREIVFRPKAAGGMRGAEQLQWLTNREIAISGSLNPDTVEYAVVDADTGRELRRYFTHGFSLVASPGGSHVAYIGNIPHFLPADERFPQLCIDDECDIDKQFRGFPTDDTHVEFQGLPRWSPDGTKVAIAAEEYKSGRGVAIVRQIRGKSILFIPPGGNKFIGLSWDRGAVVVRDGVDEWRLESGSSEFRRTQH